MRWKAFAVIATLAVGLSCGSDRGTPMEPSTRSLTPADLKHEIQEIIDALYPPALHKLAHRSFAIMVNDMNNGNPTRAQNKAIQLIGATLQWYEDDLLLDPEGPQTTEEAMAELFAKVLLFVGITDTEMEIPLEFLGPDAAFEPCKPGGCLILTDTGFAGVRIPKGALDDLVFVGIRRLPDDPPPFDEESYPLFYEFFTFPDTDFNGEVTVGVCVVDPPDPLAPDPDIVDDLRLAHGDSTGVEILPLANAPFLDCTEASTEEALGPTLPAWVQPLARFFVPEEYFARRLARLIEPRKLYADPGNLGAKASSFSSFGAVNPPSECECCECDF